MQAILVAGFGNLGAKLLPLKWACRNVRFFILENFWGNDNLGYCGMKKAFSNEILGDLLEKSWSGAKDSDPPPTKNLSAFRDALKGLEYKHREALSRDENRHLSKIFDEHVYYCGNPEKCSSEQERYQKIIEQLIELDKTDVLLYLATRPDAYLWYLERYAPFVNRVAVDKPLATDPKQLDKLIRFSRLNPDIEIRPIDHYLFKLDFTEFNQTIENRGLKPKNIQQIDVIIYEKGLDEHRQYFIDTGIIRDMMPHVAAMLRYIFRHSDQFTGYVGNVLPVVHKYQPLANDTCGVKPTVVQASIDVNYWTGLCYVPTTIKIAKGMPEARKEILIHYKGAGSDRIDLTRKPEHSEDVSVDWEGALRYLMEDRPLAESVRSHFTFDRACEITREVLVCHEQAASKISVKCGCGDTFFEYNKEQNLLTPRKPEEKKVFVFNFDGVVVNTEMAHKQAWNTWHELLGVEKPFDEVTHSPTSTNNPPEWFELGKSNRVMINEALRKLSSSGEVPEGLDIEFSQKLYDLFCHLLRSKKVRVLSLTLLHNEDVKTTAEAEGIDEKALREELTRLENYHDGVIKFLEELRKHNYVLILASTNDPLLVQQAVDILLKRKRGSSGSVFTGFCRYFVGRRSGLNAYREIVEQYGENHERITIFDDYKEVLNNLAGGADDNICLVHMHTSERHCCCEGYEDFDKVRQEWKERNC